MHLFLVMNYTTVSMVYFPYEVHVLRLYLNVNLMLLRLLHITLQEHKISFVRFHGKSDVFRLKKSSICLIYMNLFLSILQLEHHGKPRRTYINSRRFIRRTGGVNDHCSNLCILLPWVCI